MSEVHRIVVLGSTGSIGRQTLDVVHRHPDRLQVVGLAAGRDAAALLGQAQEFPGARLALAEGRASDGIPIGIGAICDLAQSEEADLVVVAVAGVIGLRPTVAAIEAGKDIALASKEVLVAGGAIVMPLIERHGVRITPIDSEHSAVFQCLQGYRPDQVASIVLTASGGPFRGWTAAQLAQVTVEQALNHPTWRMGGKITIDSATLMNKALEIVEAKWLFGLELGQVEMVVHPQSVVHSMVRLKDGSVLAQMGWPDMRLPIQYALLYPDRVESGLRPWNPVETPELAFETYDPLVFRGPDLARQAVRAGGTMPCVFNAANEAAAAAFLRNELPFLGIQEAVESVMERHRPEPASLETLLHSDSWARQTFDELAPSFA